jgi:hypothetical protein
MVPSLVVCPKYPRALYITDRKAKGITSLFPANLPAHRRVMKADWDGTATDLYYDKDAQRPSR